MKKVNLLTEVIENKSIEEATETKVDQTNEKYSGELEIGLYEKAGLITNFVPGEEPALLNTHKKLLDLVEGKEVKLRIAFFGDSMIEGDLITQTLRQLLQERFGGYGVGYLPIYTTTGSFRQTASVKGKGWTDLNFSKKSVINPYLSGHKFIGSGSGMYVDQTLSPENTKTIEKIIYYKGGDVSRLVLDGKEVEVSGKAEIEKFSIKGNSPSFSLESRKEMTLYGVSIESPYGVRVDNFSFRGITGVELGSLSSEFLQAIQEVEPYDLIIFQYGVNMLFRPNDTNYDYYDKIFDPVLKKYKAAFPNADFLVIGAADRAFRYNGIYQTAKGLPELLRIQANFALKNGMSFYNTFATMGGDGSIVKWVEQDPPLANRDYIHPNHRGAERLGSNLYQAVLKDFEKYKAKKEGKSFSNPAK